MKIIRLRNGNKVVEIPVESNQEAIEIATSFFGTDISTGFESKSTSEGEKVIEKKISKKEEELVNKIPTIEEIIDFIKSRPRYEHSSVAIYDEFFGVHISSNPKNPIERKIYTRVYRKLNDARDFIAEKEGGEWKEETEYPINAPKRKVYTFSKSDLDSKLKIRSQTTVTT